MELTFEWIIVVIMQTERKNIQNYSQPGTCPIVFEWMDILFIVLYCVT